MEPYRTIGKGQYGFIYSDMEPYRTIKSHAGQYTAIQDNMKLFRII